ncbi:unnamed protein product [Candida verbasci]|uniref:AB hydrolase-1 domain-containing protein n=1 Tax=Candida verbasci TaxID=1227364 RepID=A0A9W4U186_9ASCO|nr:unnamed protein product [Candida verbasci]
MSTQIETTTSSSTSIRPPKQNELTDGRKQPDYTYLQSWKDWFKQSWDSNYSDELVEHRLLSSLPFYPKSDGKRIAKLINTDIGNGDYIHEFYIENIEPQPNSLVKSGSPPCKEIVLVHGYGASLGLFLDNFDDLTSIPGIKLHCIDNLGHGFSSRSNFPSFPSNTKEEVYKVEDWFIDSFEKWRLKRNINKFILAGHSFGGYLGCAYVLKYNKANIVDKLILISPVGVERNKFSLIDDVKIEPKISVEQEILADQEDIIQYKNIDESVEDPKSRKRKIFEYLWERNVSPFSIIRNAGPLKSKFISKWTTHRFAHIYYQDQTQFQNIHDYVYRIFNGKGSGEYAITRILSVGALAKLPLLDRCPAKFVDMNLPSLWLYGSKDWMNDEAGLEMTNEINKLSNKKYGKNLAEFGIIDKAGHHLYLDNPPEFAKSIFKFLGFKK